MNASSSKIFEKKAVTVNNSFYLVDLLASAIYFAFILGKCDIYSSQYFLIQMLKTVVNILSAKYNGSNAL